MDKQEKLNDLFRKAKSQEPQTSFEQTKGHFLNSLENQPLKTKSSQVFTFKKWIIMLSSIMTVVGITILLNTSNSIKNKNIKGENFSNQKEIENKLQNTDQTKNKPKKFQKNNNDKCFRCPPRTATLAPIGFGVA